MQFSPCMGATQLTATVSVLSGCTWTGRSLVPWISLPDATVRNGNGTIVFNVTENYDAPRNGGVQIEWPSRTNGVGILVSQAGCLYSVSQTALSFGPGGGSGSFDVITFASPNSCGGPLQDACIWTAQSNAPWITVTSGMPRSGDNPVSFTVDRNTSGTARSGTITVRDKVVQVTQAG